MLQDAKIWLAYQPTRSGTTPLKDAYRSPFDAAQWDTLDGRLEGFKIFSGTIYKLSDYGYRADGSYYGYYYPSAALELIEMLRDIASLNGWTYNNGSASRQVTTYMESPVLAPGILPNGAHYNHNIEGFDGSFLGVIGYLRNSYAYAHRTGKISLDEIKSIGIKCIAMDEPLFFASIYKTPGNFIVDGVRIQSPQWSIDEVARRAAAALAQAKAILGEYDPGLKFGDIEPLPFVTPNQVDQWVRAFEREALLAGVTPSDAKLAFFQADVVWGVAGWEQNLAGISDVLAKNAIPLNIIINGTGTEPDAVTWTDNALNALIRVANIPNLRYQSLSVQNWHWHLPLELTGSSNALAQPGTIANVARYIPALNDIKLSYSKSSAIHTPSSYELYSLTRIIATDDATTLDVTRAIETSAQIRDGLVRAIQTPVSALNGTVAIGTTQIRLPASLGAAANILAPTNLAVDLTAYTILPPVPDANFNFRNVGNSSRIGNLYLLQASGQSITLPDNIAVTLTVLNGDRTNSLPTVYGGSRSGYSYLSAGGINYIVGNATENIVDATGTGRSTITASAENASAVVRGVSGTVAQFRITGTGRAILSPLIENVRVYIATGLNVDLRGGRNIQIVVESHLVQDTALSITSSAVPASSSVALSTIKTNSKSQSVTNSSNFPIVVETSIAGASAVFSGGSSRTFIIPSSGGTIFEDPENRNATYVIRYRTAITLNARSGSSAQFEAGSSGSIVNIQSNNPIVTVSKALNISFHASTSAIGHNAIMDGGGYSSLSLRGGGSIEIGTNVSGFARISIEPDRLGQRLSLRVSAPSPQTEVILGQVDATVELRASLKRLVSSSAKTVTVSAPADLASGRLEFGVGGGVLKVMTGGIFETNILGRARIELEHPGTVYLNKNAALHVVVPESNIGLNGIGLTAAGQKVSILNSKYSVVYASASHVGVGTGTEIKAGGMGQLNIYHNGSVRLGTETIGVRDVYLYRDSTGLPLVLQMSDFQPATKVVDVTGGAVVSATERTQQVENKGVQRTRVVASGPDASLRVDGGKAGALLDIGDSRSVVLSDQLYNVLVKGPSGVKIDGGKGRLVSFDLSAGSSEVVVGNVGHIVRTGKGNTITDNSGGQISVTGTISEWNNNTLRGLGREDILQIIGVDARQMSAQIELSNDDKVLRVFSGTAYADITLTNSGNWDRVEFLSDGAGGALLRLN